MYVFACPTSETSFGAGYSAGSRFNVLEAIEHAIMKQFLKNSESYCRYSIIKTLLEHTHSLYGVGTFLLLA